MKTAFSSIIGSALISNALGESDPLSFLKMFDDCPTENTKIENIDAGMCDIISTKNDRCDCLITNINGKHISCASICYFETPKIGDPCPNKRTMNAGWTVQDNKCKADASCLVEKFLPSRAQHFDDPRERLLAIECGTPEGAPGPTPSPTYAPTPTPTPTAAPPSCDNGGYAYDNKGYCKCPAPVVVGDRFEVSVCGDATYLLPENVQPCSGPVSADPAGTGCPKKDDVAVKHCREEIISYLTGGKSGNCKAPEDATCEKLGSGAWGCVFPGNCNTVNTCMDKAKCEGDYIKDAAGHCVLHDNGYPVANENNTAAIETDKLSPLTEDVVLKGSDSGASAVAVTSLALVATMAMASIFA